LRIALQSGTGLQTKGSSVDVQVRRRS